MEFRLIIGVLCFSFITGCASSPNPKIAAPDFIERTKSVKKIGVLLAGSRVFELGVGGSKEINKDWSQQAANNLIKVSLAQLRVAGYDAVLLKNDNNTNTIANGFNGITRDIVTRYVYSARKIEAPVSVAVTELLNKEGLDALVLLREFDQVSSAGRQAIKVAAAVLGSGVYSGIAEIEIVMVDRSPAYIYYSHKAEYGNDLRTESGTSDLFSEIMIDLKEYHGI